MSTTRTVHADKLAALAFLAGDGREARDGDVFALCGRRVLSGPSPLSYTLYQDSGDTRTPQSIQAIRLADVPRSEWFPRLPPAVREAIEAVEGDRSRAMTARVGRRITDYDASKADEKQAKANEERLRQAIEAWPAFAVGERVEAGAPGTEDHDTGRVVEIAGDTATVAWDSGVRTVISLADLRAGTTVEQQNNFVGDVLKGI